jgi:hypothetical protein
VSVYNLLPHHSEQLELFASLSHVVAAAMDKINDKYGEFVITPALMMGMDDTIIDRIAFGCCEGTGRAISVGTAFLSYCLIVQLEDWRCLNSARRRAVVHTPLIKPRIVATIVLRAAALR